ncbi:MAG: DUF2867 domain-containing protein [Roseitalea sp.]|nr:DUF2867 domain-containing protein [Roseitalea sp.]MBO6721858.1 DUF2867 domain-containing protein [Roseitalea sp.]MBO6744827.1 DUF2867 domain-containing protein [Roseitalea sp.]
MVHEVATPLPDPVMPDADWADGWRTSPINAYATARAAAETVFGNMPAWARRLLVVRDILVAPLGLQTDGNRRDGPDGERIGIFSLISDAPGRVVVGMDDVHLDFRCVVDLDGADDGQTVTVRTLIRRHNRLGRTYLATILPFHRLIVRACLRRL